MLNTIILPRLTILGLAGRLELLGAPGSKSSFHRTRLDRSSNPVQSSPVQSKKITDLAAVYGKFGDETGPEHDIVKIPRRHNYHGIVNLVLDKGVRIEAKDIRGATALAAAVQSGSL